MKATDLNIFHGFDSGRAESGQALLALEHTGVTYFLGSKREDLQSRVLNSVAGRKVRNTLWALRDVSFHAYAGEIVGIVGSNGAGKTTLCRVLSGLLLPDTGTAEVHGRVSALLSMGTGFDLQLTGRENIYLNGMMLGFSRRHIDRIRERIIDFSGLGRFIEQPLKTYSSGMRGRLGFSIASMVDPDILILDEALSAGDLDFSEKAGKKMQALISEASLVLVVSHNLEFINRFCTRALWLDQGRVRADGEPEQITQTYLETCGPAPRKKKAVNLKPSKPLIGESEVIRVNRVGVAYGRSSWFRRRFLPSQKQKEEFWALDDLSFSVRQGEILGVIGQNGAGKSTLCRVLAGIMKPDKGSVRIDGHIMSLLSFGTGFDIQLSGRDNVFLNGMMLGFTKSEMFARYDSIAAFSGIEKFLDQPVKQYSSGMRTRLGFSIAAMMNPDIFIIDEALNAGDARFFEKASAKIQEMMRRARATIVVTHNMKFVRTICTRALRMEKGRLVDQGAPQEVVARYRQSIRKTKNSV